MKVHVKASSTNRDHEIGKCCQNVTVKDRLNVVD